MSGSKREASPPTRELVEAGDRSILDDLPTIAYTARCDGALTFVSRQFYRQTGTPPGAPLDAAWHEVVHPEDRERCAAHWLAALAAGTTYEDELRLRSADGTYHWYFSRALPVRDSAGDVVRYVGTALDIDGQKRAEGDLRELIARHDNVSARERLYARFGEQLSGTLALHDTVEVMLQLLVPAFADWMSVYVEKRDATGFEAIAVRHWDESRRHVVEQLIGSTFTTEMSATAEVLRTGNSMLLEQYPDDLRNRSIHPQFASHLQALGLRSAIVVPFKHAGKVIGAIHVIRGDNPVNFGPGDLLLIEELARRITPAIHNAEVYERERLVARRFQEAALPATLPDVPGFMFDAVYESAESATQIGGDWYDAFQLDDGRVVLSIGDVAGHGLDAAVTMSSVRQSLRTAALLEVDPIGMLRTVDSIVRRLGQDLLVTAFVGILDLVTLDFSFAGAGHPPPLLRAPDGSVAPLQTAGLPLGLYDASSGTSAVERLAPESILVLYTDGLTEFDRDALEGERQVVRALMLSDGVDTAHAIYQAIAAGRPARDDIAILTVRVGAAPDIRGAVQWNFDANDASTARFVRDEISGRLVAGDFSAEEVVTAELVLSELMGNVARHTQGRVQVLLDYSPRSVKLHVVDEGPAFAAGAAGPPDPWSEHGRGLFIVETLAAELEIDRREGSGNHVRVTLKRAERTHVHHDPLGR